VRQHVAIEGIQSGIVDVGDNYAFLQIIEHHDAVYRKGYASLSHRSVRDTVDDHDSKLLGQIARTVRHIWNGGPNSFARCASTVARFSPAWLNWFLVGTQSSLSGDSLLPATTTSHSASS
jgi:hypothetical protein